MQLCHELQQLREELFSATATAERLCSSLSDSELLWRPKDGRWSVAENLAHMTLTNQLYLPSLDAVINEARNSRKFSQGPFKPDWLGAWFVKMSEPPYRIKVSSPSKIAPKLQGPPTDVLAQFVRCQKAVEYRMESANGLDLARIKFASPYASFMKVNLFSAFRIVTVHERLHLYQIDVLLPEMAQAQAAAA